MIKRALLVPALLTAFGYFVTAQINLPFNETFNSTYSSNFYTSTGTSNSGSTYTCVSLNGVGQITSSGYLTTKTLYVGQGKGVTISFKLKSGGTFTAPDVYVRINNAYSFSTSSPTDNGWVKVGAASANGCNTNTFTVPSEIAGGQKMSVTIHFKSASSTNWIAIDDLSITETTGNTVPTTYTENFTVNTWWNSGSHPKIPYHSSSSSGNCFVYLFSGGTGGSFDYYAAFTTGFDPNTTNMITQEINTGGYSKGELRYSFRAQYPCSGPPNYTFDETYALYTPKAYIMVGADNGSNSWQPLPVNSYFPDATWRYVAVDISAYRNSNIKIKFERGGFCSNYLEGVDNIKVLDRDCSISNLTCGPISGTTTPSPNTNYNYSVGAVTGATFYKWYVRNGGTLYDAAPYIVSGQGTQNATINFGNLSAPLRVICIPFDANPAVNSDACYAKLAYTSMTSCTPPVIGSTSSTNPNICGGSNGSIQLNGLTANTTYSVTYSKDGNPVSAADYTTDANGVLTIQNLGKGSYTNIVVSNGGCSSTPVAGPVMLTDPTGTPVGTPVFSLGSTSSRCASAATITYTATATNNTGLTYSLDANSLAAGNTINTSTGAVSYTTSYTGTSVITATATGCEGPKSATHTVTITSTPGTPVFSLGNSSNRCQGANSVTYTATATNSPGMIYSLDNNALSAGNTINASTGEVAFHPSFTGTAVITALTNGCSTATTATHIVTTTPPVSTPVFASGASSTRCIGAGTVAYSATASNSSSISYSLDVNSQNAGNSINSTTGEVIYSSNYTGIVIITASAAGCDGPKTATHTVTVSPVPGTPIFSSGATSSRCQGAGVVTYGATSANSTGIIYSLDFPSLGAGNTINSSTGEVTWQPTYSGTAIISASASGCGNPAVSTHTVTVSPNVGIPEFSNGTISATRCSGETNTTYSATAANATSLTYSLDGAALAGGNTINTNTGAVVWNPTFTGSATITVVATGCNGPTSNTLTVFFSPPAGTPVFAAGTTSTRCQGAASVAYTATSANSPGIRYKLDASSLLAGNTIDSISGMVNWVAGFSGTATITATATGCGNPISTHTVTVQPAGNAPVFTLGNTSGRCAGAETVSYAASVSGGGSITYSLDAAAVNAGNTINTNTGEINWDANYQGTATITASTPGCSGMVTSTHTVQVSTAVTPAISIAANPGNIICAGTTVTFNASIVNGGNNPQYSWKKNNLTVGANNNSYSDNNLSTGDVISCVLLSDAACVTRTSANSNNISITVKPTPATPSPGSNSPVCEGDDLQLTCPPAANATYSWTGPQGFVSSQQNPLISNSAVNRSGTYYVALTVDGCAGSPGTIEVTVHSKPAVPAITSNGNVLSSSVTGSSYQWYLNGAPLAGTNSSSITAQSTGTYTVQVTDDNGCSSLSAGFDYLPTGLKDIAISKDFMLFPNPVTGTSVRIQASQGLVGNVFELYDVSGKMLVSGKLFSENEEWDLTGVMPGIYLVKISGVVKKLVKEF